MAEELVNVICTFCGSVCDDVLFDVENYKGKKFCKLGSGKFSPKERIKSPMIDGKEVSYEEAIEKAAEILVNAKRPLLYGWASTVNEAIRLGVILTEKVGGIYDQCASVCHAPGTLALIEEGVPGGSLGEIKNRADMVVFWGSNPLEAHPRHPMRYSVRAKGLLIKDRKDRKVVVVDVRKTKSANMADLFIKIKPGYDYPIISALRAIIKGEESAVPSEVGGVKKELLKELADMMVNAKYGAVLYGLGVTQSRGRDRNIENAIKLIQLLNRKTRWIIWPMRGHYNVVGAGEVPAWEAGYTYAIDFSRGYPRFSPGEFSANEVLQRKDCDAALIIASDPVAHFPRASVAHLKKIPVIQIDPFPNMTTLVSNVVIPSAVAGIEAEGTAYRMDGIPFRVKKVVETEYWSDEQILEKMLEKVDQLMG
ncbi:formylmethanofuran dehydrogenase, subunit B [Archaeoglobus sulfaticallidus PM70-1]|uniref:Formylmethanofuran dehydrogenase, subunit B n=1 Tax=Archaeoglobus sulfaticallidus PM70-1 TaxID=387631 RepID=N0BMT9_9EURY|nr:formylmethanofuran dehydrogenase subunit B [Archaeoglobus sulfaticallidus]AGK61575.1 formylmethanofuran dehydrogenase, subunit B [Archaeoglobus sulfaticallidus PM70-1]